jgi:RING finger protein 113A
MFRKPKKLKTAGIRRRAQQQQQDDDNDDEHETETETKTRQEELSKARKRAKTNKGTFGSTDDADTATTSDPSDPSNTNTNTNTNTSLMHQYQTQQGGPAISQKDLVTSVNELHHPGKKQPGSVTNKFLAGPIKATTHIRTTCRFDYQPDICKDYKDTGFCGFGDTCIYLHDRGDTMSGWQLELQWQEQQDAKRKQQEAAMEEFMNKNNGNNSTKNNDATTIPDDGIPFACLVCRNAFTDPMVTTCGHYFCQACIVEHVKEVSVACPVCNKDTHNVFHEPTKLLSKKRKVVGRDASWEEYMEACQNNNSSSSSKKGDEKEDDEF